MLELGCCMRSQTEVNLAPGLELGCCTAVELDGSVGTGLLYGCRTGWKCWNWVVVQSCARGLHTSSCGGVCPLLRTCDMCTLYSSTAQHNSTLSTTGLPATTPACVWCVKEAACYPRHGTTPRRLYILCWREHSRRKLSPTLATPTTLVLTMLVAQCELSRH